jgi:hypothetical protein
MATALQFDPAAHIYSLNGVAVPNVTSILEEVGIIDYSAIPDGARMMALERGRFVHALCEYDDDDTLDESTVDPKLSGYLSAWRRFRAEAHFEPSLIEHRGYNATFGYAGTLDRTGRMPGKSDVLLDIKTSCAPWWAAVQTAAYAHFFDSPAKYRRMAVALHADGTYAISEYRCARFSADFNVFLAALQIMSAKRSHK